MEDKSTSNISVKLVHIFSNLFTLMWLKKWSHILHVQAVDLPA